MPLSLVLDILLALLLAVTIGYAIILNKRLEALRSDKDELRRLAGDFAETTKSAEIGISELRSKSDILDGSIKRAESLRDDLVFLMERGNSTADRLENVLRDLREEKPNASTVSNVTKANSVDEAKAIAPSAQRDQSMDVGPIDSQMADDVTGAELELLKALRSTS
tara:strand:- start:1129 stop:1626 length:498 start_codon:yes stop_codon:yes gene_type:complete